MAAATPIKIAILPGDGIGPEISVATRAVLEAAARACGFPLDLIEAEIGFPALERTGSTLPDDVVTLAQHADGIVLGPVSHNDYPPRADGGLNPSGELRIRLDLYANIRPARTFAGIPPATGKPMDLVIFRENTEGFYADRNLHLGPGEIMPTEDTALSFRRVTRAASQRIADAAFAEAVRRKRSGAGPGRVTAVHKANVLRVGDGLFLDCVRKAAAANPDIAYEEVLVDAMCALLVRDPGVYDVLCTTNMFGDILSDLAAELAGGIGLAASLNAGDTHAMAQAQHGSAPGLAGKDMANPSSLIGSAGMLLRWIGERRGEGVLVQASAGIQNSLEAVLSNPGTRTPDLGGPLGTQAFARAVVDAVRDAGGA